MAISVGEKAGDEEIMMEINMTPLIDVMLVLIIMLIITIPIQHHAINMNNPLGDPPPPTEPPVAVTVDIDPTGNISWNGSSLTDRKDLEAHLRQIASQPNQDEVHLHPDKSAAYQYVAEVMATAQRLGVSKIGIVGNEALLP